jgi:hypothetical protein
MAAVPSAAFPRRGDAPIYPKAAAATSLQKSADTTMTPIQTRPDFRKAIDGIVGARTREATRQISRPYEFQLIGAITKRPN